MCINLKFLHMWSNLKFLHMTDVEKSEVSPHLACVWCGECLYIYTCYAVLSKNWFCCDLRRFVAKSVFLQLTHFCVEKNLTKDCVCGEKLTNIRYGLFTQLTYPYDFKFAILKQDINIFFKACLVFALAGKESRNLSTIAKNQWFLGSLSP